MPFPREIIASGVSGVVVTLLGVLTGGAHASRAQRRQWSRDQQITAMSIQLSAQTLAITCRVHDKYEFSKLD